MRRHELTYQDRNLRVRTGIPTVSYEAVASPASFTALGAICLRTGSGLPCLMNDQTVAITTC